MKPFTAKERKERPVYSGVLRYFPKALLEIARVSHAGNEQHHPGKPLHWDRAKSTDEADALVRHLLEAGTFDTDGQRHTAKVAWRALALLEKELEADPETSTTVQELRTFKNNERGHYDDRQASARGCPRCERKAVTRPCAGAGPCPYDRKKR